MGALLVVCPTPCALTSQLSLQSCSESPLGWRWGRSDWLHFLPEAQLAAGDWEGNTLYKLAMKAVKQDGQGSGQAWFRIMAGPWNAEGPLLRSQCLFTVYLS